MGGWITYSIIRGLGPSVVSVLFTPDTEIFGNQQTITFHQGHWHSPVLGEEFVVALQCCDVLFLVVYLYLRAERGVVQGWLGNVM